MATHQPRIIDILLQIHAGQNRPHFLPFIGEPDIFILWGFVLGIETAQIKWHGADPEYMKFRDWLRDEKHAFPSEGWHILFLQRAGGIHLQAVLHFLEHVVEFRRLYPMGTASP